MENELREIVATALVQAGAELTDAGLIEFTVPPDPSHGDLSTNAALVYGKKLALAPRALGEALAAALAASPAAAGFARVDVAGPGFINVTFRDEKILGVIPVVLAEGDNFGLAPRPARPVKTQLEFVSANPTGPLNAVSARAAAFGDSLARLLEFGGADVQREFLVNDVGTQIDLLAQSVRARLHQAEGRPADVPEQGYHGEYVTALARALEGEGRVTAASDDDTLGKAATAALVESQQRDLADFGVFFDRWFRQSELYPEKVAAAEQAIRRVGAAYEKDAALWFRTTAAGDDEDRVIVRSDGRPTYFLADIAYHMDKYERGFEKVINVLGPDHHGHVKKMYAMAKLLGMPAGWLEIIISQQVNLLESGAKIKMSKRAGNLVTMREVTDSIGVDAARFFFLMRATSSHLDFDLALARKQSPENPVYYAQYCHARVASLIRESATDPARESAPLGDLTEPSERLLARKVWEFPIVVAAAAARREPHRLSAYVGELAAQFHNYYHHFRVLQAPTSATRLARLALAAAVGQTVGNALALMGVHAPVRM